MAEIRNCQISGWGTYLPEGTVKFGNQTRYFTDEDTTQLDMLSTAGIRAIEKSGRDVNEIDCIIGAVAIGPQPMPATGPLVQEIIAPNAKATSFDVNSSCTSFLTALDYASHIVDSGERKNVLIVSGDLPRRFLSPKYIESYELFSDAAAGVVISQADKNTQGVIASDRRTWPKYAHTTEVRGGLTALAAKNYESAPEEYLFDMRGFEVLKGVIKVVPEFFEEFKNDSGLEIEDFETVIPHQASKALGLMMKLIDIPEGKYQDWVQSHGNMISASIPFILCELLENQKLKEGHKVLLCGTAAGLSVNVMAVEL